MNYSKKLPLTIIILTFNEEKNIEDCILSISSWVENIFIVDSYSQDKTLDIARKYTQNIYEHPFENYAAQRNWALQNLPITTEWVMNMDADHRATEKLQRELIEMFSKGIPTEIKGLLVSRRTIFMGQWIKHGGHYPVFHAIIFRHNFGSCEERLYDQHFLVAGKMLKTKGDMIDIITDSLYTFTERHNKWAGLEALEQLDSDTSRNMVQAKITGHAIEKRRFLRNFYGKFPLFLRPFLYFSYRYFFRLGFLDGKAGLVFHFLQGFWYRFLIDARIYEIKIQEKKQHKGITGC